MDDLDNNHCYDSWRWKPSDYNSLTEEQHLPFFVRAGMLAASVHNSQPWRVELLSQKEFILTADPEYSVVEGDPSKMGLKISLGCFLMNVEVAAEYFNYQMTYKIDDQSILVSICKKNADLSLAGEDGFFSDLCLSITDRRSNKFAYRTGLGIDRALQEIQAASSLFTGIEFHYSSEQQTIEDVSVLHQRAIRNIRSPFWRELFTWSPLLRETSCVGIPPDVFGISDRVFRVMRYFFSKFPSIVPVVMSAKDKKLIRHKTPLIGVISSSSIMGIEDGINVGRFYEFASLYAAKYNFAMTPIHAMVEDKQMNHEVSSLFGISSGFRSQMIFRFGYPVKASSHTPRMSFDDILI